MTIRELIESLEIYDQELDIYISSDEEGNTIKPVCDVINEKSKNKDLIVIFP